MVQCAKITISNVKVTTIHRPYFTYFKLKSDFFIQIIPIFFIYLTQDHQNVITTGEYGVFLRFLFNFMTENAQTEIIQDFCDFLFSNGYLITLPQTHIIRCIDTIINYYVQ